MFCNETPCIKCKWSYYKPIDGYMDELICRRLQNIKCDYTTGENYYVGKTLNCESEREVCLTWMEKLLGPNKDKCGKEGKYFVSKEE